jgi:hypothetical protein
MNLSKNSSNGNAVNIYGNIREKTTEQEQSPLIRLLLNRNQVNTLRRIFLYMKDDKRIPDIEKISFIDVGLQIIEQTDQYSPSVLTHPSKYISKQAEKIETEILRARYIVNLLDYQHELGQNDQVLLLKIYEKYIEKLEKKYEELLHL